jgi:8-oxo-dGTP pyrophosphatase MutT (NUDIX family)
MLVHACGARVGAGWVAGNPLPKRHLLRPRRCVTRRAHSWQDEAAGPAQEETTPANDASHQAAAFPFRSVKGSVEICLIRKRDGKVWGIPKGMVDPGDTLEETALNEAEEEAGLEGRLVGASIGRYEYEKWGVVFSVATYLLEVQIEHATWDEMSFRERRWWPIGKVADLLAKHPVRPLLPRVIRALSTRGKPVG